MWKNKNNKKGIDKESIIIALNWLSGLLLLLVALYAYADTVTAGLQIPNSLSLQDIYIYAGRSAVPASRRSN